MAFARGRRIRNQVDYWPGFVDAMATLLLAIMFLLTAFVLAQFLLGREITGKDAVLNRLTAQIDELTALLSFERSARRDLEEELGLASISLGETQAERDRLQGLLDSQSALVERGAEEAQALAGQVEDERKISRQALSQVELLNRQIAALRQRLASIQSALEASEARESEAQIRIVDLGKRLNVALAKRVQELNRYRSDFFGRLREILSEREGIRVVGDRFVFPSEVLFASARAELNADGREQMSQVAEILAEVSSRIPADIGWVLRVDGHTDDVPLSPGGRYRDNWELSQARALAVVQFFIERGIPPERLVAAGFAEFHPLERGESPEVRARNRRIELKLTER